MSIISFFSKLRYGSYKNSSRAWVYEKIAKEHRMPPQQVYAIAHGKRPKTHEDQLVLDDLVTKGIIITKSF
jgi:hypothetical protein